MTPIPAYQHIYANVEKEQSPRRQGGFQTLFYSRAGLAEAEVEEMEARLLYFPSAIEPVKRLFFTTSSGKGVVSQIVSLPEPDQAGRKGRYLAHSLVFEPGALAQFEADPFRIFRHFPFITGVAEALARGDFQTGDLPPVSLALPAEPEQELAAAVDWPAAELGKLALLALRAGLLAGQREAVTLAGEPARLEAVLAAAFVAVPAALRPRCIFDTYFYRCNLVATYFWAIGLPEPPAGVKFALVTASERAVQGPAPLQPETAYERWVVAAIEAGRLADLIRERDRAFDLAEWLDGRRDDPANWEAISLDLITELFRAHPTAVQAALRRRVGQYLPPVLASRASHFLQQQADAEVLSRRLRLGFDLAELLEVLHRSYAAQEFQAPARAEIEALATLLEQADQPMLRLALACWRSPRQQLPAELARVSETDYRRFGETALRLKLVKPLTLLVPGRGAAFLDLYLGADLGDWAELVRALLAAGETDCLERLVDHIPLLPAEKLSQLERLISRRPDVPAPFRAAVNQAIAALPPKRGLGAVLEAIRRRWPPEGS